MRYLRPELILEFLICLALPLLLVGWTIWSPFTIGNDYVIWPVFPNVLTTFYRSQDIPTIWYPYYTGGVPFSGVPAIQYFNPLNWLLTFLPNYMQGGALLWNSAKHVVLFALSHFLLIRFLRSCGPMRFFTAFLLSGAVMYNLRTLDQLRYGIYLDVVCYFQAAVIFAYWYLKHRNPLSLVIFGILVQSALTCGYPPSLFMGGLICALVVILAPTQIYQTLVAGSRNVVGACIQLSAAGVIAFMLAAPNVLPAFEMLEMNSVRVINSTFEWARGNHLTWPGVFANIFAPWHAEVHSAFGGSALWTILLFAGVIFCLSNLRRYWWAIVLLLFPFLYSFGGTIHWLCYEYVPGFRWMRIPGRITAVGPLVLIAIVALSFGPHLRQMRESVIAQLRRCVFLSSTIVFALLSAWCISLMLDPDALDLSGSIKGFTPDRIAPWTTEMRWAWLGTGWLTSVIGILWFRGSATRAMERVAFAAVALLFVAQGFLIFRYGSWQVLRDYNLPPTQAQFLEANHLPFHHTYPLVGPIALDEIAGGMATTGYTRFMKASGVNADCFLPVVRADGDRRTLLPFYLTRAIGSGLESCKDSASDQATIVSDIRCDDGLGARAVVPVTACEKIESSTGAEDLIALNRANRLTGLTLHSASLKLKSPSAAVLVTPYSYVGAEYWEVRINNRPAEGMIINAGMLGVVVHKGVHQVDIRYVSKRSERARYIFMTGIGALTVWICAVLLIRWRVLQPNRRALLVVLCVSLAAATAYSRLWALSYRSEVNRKVLLSNNYATLLKQQIQWWKSL